MEKNCIVCGCILTAKDSAGICKCCMHNVFNSKVAEHACLEE